MHPVGADQQPSACASPVLEAQRDCVGILLHTDATRVQMDAVGGLFLKRIDKNAVQVGTVDEDVGSAVALLGNDAEVEELPSASALPVPDLLGLRPHRPGIERRLEPQRPQHTRAVGAELHAGPDLAQLGRLLVDLDVDAALPQGERASQPADAGADNDDRIS